MNFKYKLSNFPYFLSTFINIICFKNYLKEKIFLFYKDYSIYLIYKKKIFLITFYFSEFNKCKYSNKKYLKIKFNIFFKFNLLKMNYLNLSNVSIKNVHIIDKLKYLILINKIYLNIIKEIRMYFVKNAIKNCEIFNLKKIFKKMIFKMKIFYIENIFSKNYLFFEKKIFTEFEHYEYLFRKKINLIEKKMKHLKNLNIKII